MRFAGLAVISACAPLPPPRAVVAVHAPDEPVHAVLVTPTACVASEELLCSPEAYQTEANRGAPVQKVDELVDPIVRLKLELAGYTLSDARTLRLATVDRTDVSLDESKATHVDQGPTVADLSPADQAAAAGSLGLAGVLRSTLRVSHPSNFAPPTFELVLEMFAIPQGTLLWTVHCSELFENFTETSRLLASCVGDGVLAWRAPDAVIGRQAK